MLQPPWESRAHPAAQADALLARVSELIASGDTHERLSALEAIDHLIDENGLAAVEAGHLARNADVLARESAGNHVGAEAKRNRRHLAYVRQSLRIIEPPVLLRGLSSCATLTLAHSYSHKRFRY